MINTSRLSLPSAKIMRILSSPCCYVLFFVPFVSFHTYLVIYVISFNVDRDRRRYFARYCASKLPLKFEAFA